MQSNHQPHLSLDMILNQLKARKDTESNDSHEDDSTKGDLTPSWLRERHHEEPELEMPRLELRRQRAVRYKNYTPSSVFG